MDPRVSVVMAVRDGERYVAEAVQSLLVQSFGDFELIVVDDGSVDGTPAVLDGFTDPRIVRLRNDRPLGAAAARNRAIDAARGEILAIHDADDVAAIRRLTSQVDFLDANPAVGICASRYVATDPAGVPVVGSPWIPAGEAPALWQLLLFSNPVCHSTVAVRRGVVDAAGAYDATLEASHDRDFVSRLVRASRLHVLPEELVRFRLHPRSLGACNGGLQRANSLHVRRNLLRWFLGPGAVVVAIDSWYEAPIPAEKIAPLTALLLRTFSTLVERLTPPAHEIELVRTDLAQRLESIRLRDGRVPRERLAREFASSVVRGTLSKLGFGRRTVRPAGSARAALRQEGVLDDLPSSRPSSLLDAT